MPDDFSDDAPLSAEDSAAQKQIAEESSSDSSAQAADADFVSPRLRVVSGGEPFYDDMEARMESGYGSSTAPFLKVVASGNAKRAKANSERNHKQKPAYPGLKKETKRQIAQGAPPTPKGFEWRPSDEGWGLWHNWSEWNDDKTERIKKSRYAGHLSHDAWEIMKEYDREAFISNVGEQIRGHSGRQSVRRV